ncbi:MAG: type II secretion system protein [Acidobacteria bacterium]|nr:type II secretion system protein [Acidobacteriota bacterium]
MRNKEEKGFSLIELLIVVVILGIVSALAVPAFQRALIAAESRSVHATMRTMSSNQAMFFSQNQRFARLDELNAISDGGLGTLVAPRILRNNYEFEMTPVNPTDTELQNEYEIKANRYVDGVLYSFKLTNTNLVRVYPSDD